MSIPNTGRLAAHVLIDALAAYSEEAPQEVNEGTVNLALARLAEVGAVDATEEGEGVRVDISNVVSPAIMAMLWLSSQLAAATGVSEEEVFAEMREFFDEA